MNGYIVLRLLRSLDTNVGFDVRADVDGLIGVLPVYESEKAARDVWGDDVALQWIQYGDEDEEK